MRLEAINLPAAAAVIIFLLLMVLGKTKGEVGRLWIFMIPLVCLGAASELTKRFGHKSNRIAGAILMLQFVSIILIKKYHDFW